MESPARTKLRAECVQVEGRKRYEFLEALVVSMDGHLRYFKRGYEVTVALQRISPLGGMRAFGLTE